MNFLAHLLTGDSGDETLIGSFAGDFCRGRLDAHPEELRRGIRLHRMVDAFADGHPEFSSIRALLRPALGLYAAVGADMLIDHLLAREWERWVPRESLGEFAARAGEALLNGSPLLPPSGGRIAALMVDGRWLESYARRDGIRTALERMSFRARRGVRLDDALERLDLHEESIRSSTDGFLRDLFSSNELRSAGLRGDLSGRLRYDR